MEKTIFGKTELAVSTLGFGSAHIGVLETPLEQVYKLLDLVYDRGVNLIDTAPSYGQAETTIGQWLARSGHRDDLVLVSKCGKGAEDLPGEKWSKPNLTASIDRSLQRLGTDHLDVMLLHSCGMDVLEKGEAIEALTEAADAGKVRFPGYSGDNEEAYFAAGHDVFSVIETSVNITDQANLDYVLPRCIEHDKAVIAKRPLGGAPWRQINAQPTPFQGYAKEYTRRLEAMGITPRELGYYGHTEVEWPEIALKFTRSIPGVHSAIVGMTSTVNARANIDAIEKNPLREQVVARIREAFRDAQQADERAWEGKE